jgi:hypothetical protein
MRYSRGSASGQLGTPTERYETAAAHEVLAIVGQEIRASRQMHSRQPNSGLRTTSHEPDNQGSLERPESSFG